MAAPSIPVPRAPDDTTPGPPLQGTDLWLVAVLGLLLGVAIGLGVGNTLLVVGVVGVFGLVFVLARPEWVVTVYVVLIYANLLSILSDYHGLPPVARFAGALVLFAVFAYRLIARRLPLVGDELTWWLLVYGFVLALGLGYARNPGAVVSNLIEFARNFITFLVILNTVNTRARLQFILWGLLLMGTILASLTVYQTVTGRFDQDFGGLAQYHVSEISGGTDAPRPSGTLGDANYYGQLLIIVLPIALYFLFRKRSTGLTRLIGLGTAGILAAGTVFTYSRGDGLALIALGICALIFLRPRLSHLLALVVLGVLVFPLVPSNYVERMSTILQTAQNSSSTIYTDRSLEGRLGTALAAVYIFLDHPILGVGRENYTLYELDYISGTALAYQNKSIPPHDLYLEVAAEQGIIGILAFTALLLATGRALREAWRRFRAVGDDDGASLAAWLAIGLIAYLVSGLFLHGAYLYVLWLQIALIAALRQIARNETPALAISGRDTLRPPPRSFWSRLRRSGAAAG